MFTQSMPALAQALAGALPEAAIQQLMQSLGNCQQPLTHRGAINLQPPTTTGAGGLARPGTWNANDHTDILPKAGDNVFVDMPGNNTTNQTVTNTSNYAGHNFHFPINQDFNYNNYYGGDTFNVAGNSVFDNSTHQTVNTTNINTDYINNTYVGNDGRDGVDGRNGRDGVTTVIFQGGPGQGGPDAGPFASARTRILKSVTVNGTVSVPHVTDLKVANSAVTVGTTTTDAPLTVSGTVEVPTVESATISTLTATGTATLPTVTGVTLSGATAGGNISYDTYPTATCSPISGSVSLPTGGNFTAAITGITASAGLGTLSGMVTIPIPTSGYLDASCKLVLVTTNTDYAVTFSGAPSVSVGGPAAVTGSVSLTGSTSTPVSISTPAITLTKSSGSASASLAVSGGTYKLTSGTTSVAITVTATSVPVSLTAGTIDVPVSASGTCKVTVPTGTGTLVSNEVSWDEEYETKKLDLTVIQKADILVYARPRAQ